MRDAVGILALQGGEDVNQRRIVRPDAAQRLLAMLESKKAHLQVRGLIDNLSQSTHAHP